MVTSSHPSVPASATLPQRRGLIQALGGMNQSPAQLIESKTAERALSLINVPCEVTYCQPTDNSAVRFDFDFPHAIARFTWWSDCSYFSESLAIDGRQIASTHGRAADALAASTAIAELVAVTERANAT